MLLVNAIVSEDHDKRKELIGISQSLDLGEFEKDLSNRKGIDPLSAIVKLTKFSLKSCITRNGRRL